MPATLDEVKQVIREAFPDANVDGVKEEDYRVLGTIVSQEFQDKNTRERNRLVTRRVRDKLGLRGINVGVLFPLAPGETL
jgi:stress-induced morphogen